MSSTTATRQVSCSDCAATYRVPATTKAQSARCKKCGGVVPLQDTPAALPAVTPAAVAVAPIAAAPAAEAPVATAIPAPAIVGARRSTTRRPRSASPKEARRPEPEAPQPASRPGSSRRARASGMRVGGESKASPVHILSGIGVLVLVVGGIVLLSMK